MAKKTVNDRLVAINVALEHIGKKDKHAAPSSQDPLDAVLHEYDVATIGESYFKKRREKAKAAMLSQVSPESQERVAKAIANTKDLEQGQSVVVIETQHFTANMTTKNGASFVDDKVLCNELAKAGVSREIIDKAVKKATQRRDPSCSYTIAEREQ